MTDKYQKRTQGFTLVELSIVIIIIGFLIAGIAAGQSLIKQAALNSVISDFQMYQTAYTTFVGRYGEVPGDMKDGYAYWGAACGTNDFGTDTSCNGNGNGMITLYGDYYNESLIAWKHLSLAGVITSLPGPVNPNVGYGINNPTLGQDVPTSKITGAGYSVAAGNINSWAESTDTFWNDNSTNAVYIGKLEPTPFFLLDSGAISAIDAFNIDQKMDDGHADSSGNLVGAASGNVRTFEGGYNTQYSCLLSNNYAPPYYYNPNGQGTGCVTGMALN